MSNYLALHYKSQLRYRKHRHLCMEYFHLRIDLNLHCKSLPHCKIIHHQHKAHSSKTHIFLQYTPLFHCTINYHHKPYCFHLFLHYNHYQNHRNIQNHQNKPLHFHHHSHLRIL